MLTVIFTVLAVTTAFFTFLLWRGLSEPIRDTHLDEMRDHAIRLKSTVDRLVVTVSDGEQHPSEDGRM